MLKPDFFFDGVCDITIDFMKENGIGALILDIDNTIAVPDKTEIPEKIQQWLSDMKKNGVKMIILSNNTEERVSVFAKKVGLPYVSEAMKPKKSGYLRAAALAGETTENCACVGDQIFTDVWGGRRAGAVTVLTKPFERDQTAFIRFKRILEKPFTAVYCKKEKNR